MNWKIIEIECNCELERFLTWHDAIKYMYAKKLDFKIFEIVPIEKRASIVRSHNILTLSDLGKDEPYKDAIIIKDVKKFKKPLLKKVRYIKNYYLDDGILKTYVEELINNSDHHKTNLNDLCTK